MTTALHVVQGDGAHLEVFVTSRGTHDVAECDPAKAVRLLGGTR
ncbi:hypothetical protein [Roseovarius sp. SCSIO 43702]|nr:hypothetical protein [Roseovarius sp. SCSIO 43702]